MSFISGFFGKKNVNKNVDWNVYYEDKFNGMPEHEQQAKLESGGYIIGNAQVSTKYGRIDRIEQYEYHAKKFGKAYAETMRRNGFYMNS